MDDENEEIFEALELLYTLDDKYKSEDAWMFLLDGVWYSSENTEKLKEFLAKYE